MSKKTPQSYMADPSLVLGTTLTKPHQSVVLTGHDLTIPHHVMGTTGAGKSRLLASMFLQLLNQGIACSLVDPAGDTARLVLAYLLETGFYSDKRAFGRLLYYDFSQVNQTQGIPLNILALPHSPYDLANMVTEICRRAWATTGAAVNMENILLASTVVLVQNHQPLTMMGRLLTNAEYRAGLLANVGDPLIQEFFTDRFAGYGKQAGMLSESSLRRIFLLTFSPVLRYSLGQASALNVRRLIDANVSCIFNLSNLDPQTQRFLGCLLTVQYEMAALSRADLPPEERVPHHLFIDEWSQFASQSSDAVERMLALCRKYCLSVTLAHQTWSQASKDLQGALQNAIHILLKLGYDDAAWAAPRFADHSPYRLKYAPPRLPWEPLPTHPIFFTESETQGEFRQKMQDMAPGQALVRLNQTTSLIQTITVPEPKVNPRELAALEQEYVRLLFQKVNTIGEPTEQKEQKKTSRRGKITPDA